MNAVVNNASFWDRAARKYAAGPIADLEGYERTLECTRHYLDKSDTVFEFGCGTGTTALKLAPSVRRIAASDQSREMIALAQEAAQLESCENATFEVATPDEAAWLDESFDAVLGFNVLHLLPDRERALRNIQRILKPEGVFISKTPCLREMNPLVRAAIPVMQVIGKAPYVSAFSADDLERLIESAGFVIVERARHGSSGKDARPFIVAKKQSS